MGSLHDKLEELYGNKLPRRWGGRDENRFNVIAIEGLADAPGLGGGFASSLLSRIGNYAYKEQKIVTVAKRAIVSRDRVDLTDYYVGLGFEKVHMQGRSKEDDWHELVFIGSPMSEDTAEENDLMMAGMNLWTKI